MLSGDGTGPFSAIATALLTPRHADKEKQRLVTVMRRLISLLGFAALTVAAVGGASGWAQESQDVRPLLDRLDRLERDMNMLQRQVYSGGSSSGPPKPAPPPDAGGSATALDIDVRMGRIEDQIRTLTGQIEETSYKTEQLRQRLDKLSSDIDFRLSQIEHPGAAPPAPGSDAAPAGSAPPNTQPQIPGSQPQNPAPSDGPIQLRPPGAGGDPSAAPSKSGSLGFIPAGPGGGAPVMAPSASGSPPDNQAAVSEAAAPPANATPKDQYNYAFSLLRQQKFDDAAQALRAFIKNNPKDDLAGSAQYWLGESYYVRKDYANAAPIFAEGYEKYPKNVKAPYELLGLGLSLGALSQKDNACHAFARLDRDFPQGGADIKQQASAAKKRLGCGG